MRGLGVLQIGASSGRLGKRAARAPRGTGSSSLSVRSTTWPRVSAGSEMDESQRGPQAGACPLLRGHASGQDPIPEHREPIERRLGRMPTVLEAVNALQATPWQVNKRV